MSTELNTGLNTELNPESNVEMTEAQIKEAIIKLNNSEEYLKLNKYYDEESFIKILHVSRDEKIHSNFIAWLLSPKSHHELNYYPLQKFLQMLSVVVEKENNKLARFPDEYVDKFLLEDYELSESCEVRTEFPTGAIAGFDNNGRIDILINLSFKDSNKVLPIIIENKVHSIENDENKKNKNSKKNKQTEKYFDWSEEKYKDKTKYETPILIFLAPDYEKDIVCKCDSFIKVSYQNLVDYFIEPCLMKTTNVQAEFFIDNYLRCLSNSTINNEINKKEGRIMAFSKKEKELLEKFHEKNKELFDAVLTMLAEDENLSPEERSAMKKAQTVSNNKDYSKYLFRCKTLGKGKLVLEVVKAYVTDNPTVTFDELLKVFPDNLQGSKGVVRLFAKVSNEDKGIGGTKRYYINDKEKIVLTSGEEVVVSDQWGAGNIGNFIDNAINNLNYDIQKL